jgi:hypothetical protein
LALRLGTALCFCAKGSSTFRSILIVAFWSDDVPGFVLSHSDCEAVFADIQPALETILSERFSATVKVGPLESIRENLEDAGILPIYKSGGRVTYVAEVYA